MGEKRMNQNMREREREGKHTPLQSKPKHTLLLEFLFLNFIIIHSLPFSLFFVFFLLPIPIYAPNYYPVSSAFNYHPTHDYSIIIIETNKNAFIMT
jgi:hypothetical protein